MGLSINGKLQSSNQQISGLLFMIKVKRIFKTTQAFNQEFGRDLSAMTQRQKVF